MVRDRRGGRRQGTPGQSYNNRSDLNAQPIRTAPNQPYGEATQQAQAQRIAPLPQQTPVRPPLPAIDAPTNRPTEPLTAGLPIGMGPGPEAVLPGSALTGDDDTEAFLRALYSQHPNSDLARLIAKP